MVWFYCCLVSWYDNIISYNCRVVNTLSLYFLTFVGLHKKLCSFLLKIKKSPKREIKEKFCEFYRPVQRTV